MYKVRVERKAQKKLARIPEPYYSYKKLKGRNGYRIRVVDYRITTRYRTVSCSWM